MDAEDKRTRTLPRGGDPERFVLRFGKTIDDPLPLDGVEAMRFAVQMIATLEASSAPFARAAEPKRVASMLLRERIG